MARTPPDLANAMTNVRTTRIDDAVASAGELIAALTDEGPLTDKQICLLIRAAVRARVKNAEEWEIKQSVARIVTDLGLE